MTNWEDKEEVLKAVQQEGRTLQFASDALRANPEIVRAAVQQYGYALQFASKELRADPEKLADELYARGYLDRQNGKDYDPRGAAEWQVAVNAMKKSAT